MYLRIYDHHDGMYKRLSAFIKIWHVGNQKWCMCSGVADHLAHIGVICICICIFRFIDSGVQGVVGTLSWFIFRKHQFIHILV